MSWQAGHLLPLLSIAKLGKDKEKEPHFVLKFSFSYARAMQFFGFKNPFVQRLLRELVTNINGIAEQGPLPPSFSNESSRTELNNRCTDARTSPNLPPFLARSQVKEKRSKRQEITNPESLSTSGFKRSRAGAVMHIAEPSNSAPKTHKQWRSTLSFNQEQESCNLPGTLSTAVCSKPVAVGETDHSSAKDGFPSKSADCSDHLTENAAPGPEESVLAWSKSTKSTTEVINWSVEEKNVSAFIASELFLPLDTNELVHLLNL